MHIGYWFYSSTSYQKVEKVPSWPFHLSMVAFFCGPCFPASISALVLFISKLVFHSPVDSESLVNFQQIILCLTCSGSFSYSYNQRIFSDTLLYRQAVVFRQVQNSLQGFNFWKPSYRNWQIKRLVFNPCTNMCKKSKYLKLEGIPLVQLSTKWFNKLSTIIITVVCFFCNK